MRIWVDNFGWPRLKGAKQSSIQRAQTYVESEKKTDETESVATGTGVRLHHIYFAAPVTFQMNC